RQGGPGQEGRSAVLFNSLEFVFGFLPFALAGFWILGALNRSHAALLWLLLASLFFYAYWRFTDLWVLLVSIAFNYLLSRAIVHGRAKGKNPRGVSGSRDCSQPRTLGLFQILCLLGP